MKFKCEKCKNKLYWSKTIEINNNKRILYHCPKCKRLYERIDNKILIFKK